MDIQSQITLDVSFDINAESHATFTKLMSDFVEMAAKQDIEVEVTVEDVQAIEEEIEEARVDDLIAADSRAWYEGE